MFSEATATDPECCCQCCWKLNLITAVLKSLHWLPESERIDFKILILVYKALNGSWTKIHPGFVFSIFCI